MHHSTAKMLTTANDSNYFVLEKQKGKVEKSVKDSENHRGPDIFLKMTVCSID